MFASNGIINIIYFFPQTLWSCLLHYDTAELQNFGYKVTPWFDKNGKIMHLYSYHAQHIESLTLEANASLLQSLENTMNLLMYNNLVQEIYTYPIIFTSICFALYSLISSFSYALFHLKGIPGPWWARYTRLWLLRTLASEDCANRYREIGEQYGMSWLTCQTIKTRQKNERV